MSSEPAFPEVIVTTRPKERAQNKTRRIPPYHVVLDNDDHHSFEFVVDVLQKALGFSAERAFVHTQQAHRTGRSVVWTGTKEVAELKVEQIRSFHEIREPDKHKLGPLSCSIEPAPGG